MNTFKQDTEKHKQEHPSFGMVSLSRVNSNHGKLLFGSSILPQSWVTLRICQGSKTHHLGTDWYSAHQELVEVNLSAAQFAELITTMNHGTGVPCTISRLTGQMIKCFEEHEDSKEARMIVETIRAYGKKVSEPLDTFISTINKQIEDKKISKKAGEEIKEHFFRMNQDLKSNIPFYVDQLDESTEKIIVSKKAEMDAFATTMITQLGLTKLDELKKINE